MLRLEGQRFFRLSNGPKVHVLVLGTYDSPTLPRKGGLGDVTRDTSPEMRLFWMICMDPTYKGP